MAIPDIQGVAESTYQQTYRGKLPDKPPIKYKTLPCLYPPGSTEQCGRGQPQEKRTPLKRVNKPVVNPITPRPPTASAPQANSRPRSAKRNVADNKVIDTKFGPMDMATINKLHYRHRYTSSNSRAMAECYVPPRPGAAPLEQSPQLRPDMIQMHACKYEDAPADWQGLVLWDRLQTRDLIVPPPETPEYYYSEGMQPHRRKIINQVDERVRAKRDKILDLLRKDKLDNVFNVKILGYAGYAPLCPPHSALEEKKTPSDKISLMTDSYKRFSNKKYAEPEYGRALVNLYAISMAYPLNPLMKGNIKGLAAKNKNSYVGNTGYMLLD